MAITASGQVELLWPQQQQVDLGGSYDIYRDDRNGVVVFDSAHKLNPSPIAAWPDGEGKIGAGLGAAGQGSAGYGFGGIGAGQGAAGLGMAGFGAELMSYVTSLLADGVWKFAIVAVDAAANPSAPAAGKEVTATIAATPKPPASCKAASYV